MNEKHFHLESFEKALKARKFITKKFLADQQCFLISFNYIVDL